MTDAAVAAVIVRNTASHDARVFRCARTLRSLGYETVVIAVTSEQVTAERSVSQGIPIVRLTPRAPLAGAARALRRIASGRAGGGPVGPPSAGRNGYGEGRRLGPLARAYRLLRTLSYYRRGVAAIRALRPRVVHCNDYNTMWIGVAAKLLTGSALVYDSHELWPDRNRRSEPRWWLLACEAFFLRIADRNLATSPGHADVIARRHRVAPPRVVRNIAERPPAAVAGAKVTPPPPGYERTIVYCGALTENRGLEQAIAALPQAQGIALRFIGPSLRGYREYLSSVARRHGVLARVGIEPPVPPEQVIGEIRGAAAGVALIQPACLSYAFCLPNKLFEYLVAGLPTLAADVPAIHSFVVPNRIGLVVPPADTEAIAAAMLEIVDPDRNREMRAAVAEASAQHHWEGEAERLREFYRGATRVRTPQGAR
jgi:glycosyltransferase involved in cell wall biosynthesis